MSKQKTNTSGADAVDAANTTGATNAAVRADGKSATQKPAAKTAAKSAKKTAKNDTPSKRHAEGAVLPIDQNSHVYLIDGSGYIFRAFHALPPLTRASDGLPVGAVQGFSNMLWKLLKDAKPEDRPTHVAVIFDAGAITFRNDIYPEYKAHRPPAPEELIPQFPLVRDATKAFNVACIEQDGYEADDLIATYTAAAKEKGASVTIISSDKDLMQLVGPGVEMLDTMKNRRIGPDEVVEKFGVGPEKVIDVQSLAGDSVDNVPGVPGIGLKTAGPIVREICGLDNLLGTDKSVDTLKAELSARLADLQQKIDDMAGEPVKLGAAAQLGKILQEKFGVADHQLKEDKKGNRTADTKAVEALAKDGNEFCQLILRARELNKMINSQLDTIVKNAEQARISRKLVTLKQDVPVDIALETTGVHEPNEDALFAFLNEMEFKTLTARVAKDLGADPPPVIKAAKKSPSKKARGGSGDGARGEGGGDHDDATPDALVAYNAEQAMATPIDPAKYETVTTATRLAEWIAEAREAGHVAIDTETDSLDATQAELVGVSMAVTPGAACYLPLGHVKGDGGLDFGDDDGAARDQMPLREALDLLKPLLEDPSVLKIGQNLKYDALVLASYDVKLKAIDDTMLISYVLDAGRGSHGMDALAERHLGHRCIPFKEVIAHAPGKKAADKTFAAVPIDKATAYAAEDADVTLRLWMMLKPRLVAERMTTVYETLEHPLVQILVDMEAAGIKVDRSVLSRLSGDFAQKIGALEAEVFELTGETFNLGSPKQLGELLFDKLKLPGGKKTKTGQWETRASLLDDLSQNEELPDDARKLVNTMLEWRQLSKLKSTYTDALPGHIHPKTQRIHTSYAMAATTTGRLASTDPNLQNIPVRTKEGREIRKAFVAEKGCKLISADYSQIELRVLAHIADIAALKQAFADGLDIHAMTASEMFGVPVKDMPAEIRRRAKAINFGIIYGISAFGLANQLGIPRGEAADYIKTYFERFPGIRAYMEETKSFAREHGYVETIFGRHIHYPQITTKNPSVRAFNERAAINAPIQGSAADIIRRAMIRMPAALDAARLKDTRMLLQVHDELIFEAKDKDVNKTLKTVVSVMESACAPALTLDVPLKVDALAALNWDEAH